MEWPSGYWRNMTLLYCKLINSRVGLSIFHSPPFWDWDVGRMAIHSPLGLCIVILPTYQCIYYFILFNYYLYNIYILFGYYWIIIGCMSEDGNLSKVFKNNLHEN